MNRCKRNRPYSCFPIVCIAFGAGVIFSLCASLRFVVFLAAVSLIVLGIMVFRNC
ncbi:MAG: hypothetical protein VB100_03925 [Angelakisella sp.]|nr:hypothetical protein [Angelakisella sp.]